MTFKEPNEKIYSRERLELQDGDFLDLDWAVGDHDKLAILSHGLEGNSRSNYIMKMAQYLGERGFDSLAWNYRSCSGELNRLLRMYHHGETEDIETVIDHASKMDQYKSIILIGYSAGGSITLNYLGRKKTTSKVKGAVCFSTPCDVEDSVKQISKLKNRPYEKKFMDKLIRKIRAKAKAHPELDISGLASIKDLDTFNKRFTLPIHGFKDLGAFYAQASCIAFIQNISIPTLLVNAKNDSILGKRCYPTKEARVNPHFFLETPKHGGHCGFTLTKTGHSWMELRAFEFISNLYPK